MKRRLPRCLPDVVVVGDRFTNLRVLLMTVPEQRRIPDLLLSLRMNVEDPG